MIFSHGSLQQPDVQVSIYGRVLDGEPDELVDCIHTQVEVPTWHKAAAAGATHYANVEFSPVPAVASRAWCSNSPTRSWSSPTLTNTTPNTFA